MYKYIENYVNIENIFFSEGNSGPTSRLPAKGKNDSSVFRNLCRPILINVHLFRKKTTTY
jgi:hypothetical protein